ncbi:MAG: hypothetical protein LC790_07700 [Actinobacteria bacterium]|nr:hypothetical protein [Actinomycetota bacterium]
MFGGSRGRFVGAPSRAELERFFFLDDFDGRLVAKLRGDRNAGRGRAVRVPRVTIELMAAQPVLVACLQTRCW